jgi:two-component system, LuxR family, sensor kinase FixL
MSRRHLVQALTVAVGYYLGAKVGLALTLHPQPVSTLWPPNGILLAALLLLPPQRWPLVLLAAFPAHLAAELGAGIPVPMVLCWFVSNCSEALIGAYVFRRLASAPLRLDSFQQVTAFIISAGIAAPVISSFIDAGFVKLNGFGESSYWHVWRLRCGSNVLANLTLVPVIVAAVTAGPTAWRCAPVRRYVEAGVVISTLVAVCWTVFVVQEPRPSTSAALLYTPLPLLLWAAVRFGPNGISSAMLIFAGVAIWGAGQGGGPFVLSSPPENASAIQLFLIVTCVPLMTLAAVMAERRAAGIAQHQSEERLNIVLGAAQLCTWEWDIVRDHVEWSDRSQKMPWFSFSGLPATLEGFAEHVHADDRATFTRVIVQAVEQARMFELEFRVPRPDGTLGWIYFKGKPICDEAGVPGRVIGVKVDITDRKRGELEAENHRRELAHLGRVAVVGELSGALAHELNQPLAAILANARAGQRFLAHTPPDLRQVNEILGAIVEDDRRAGEVIMRLRALLRKDEPPRSLLEIDDILREVVGIVRSDLVTHEISIDWSLATRLPIVTGDRIQLQQVFLNLVLNACDAMQMTPRGLRRLHIKTERRPDDVVRVALADSGTGVRAESIEQIFEPFFTSKDHGLGLGLAICRSIVSAHDGRLWAENNASRGATFYLELPSVKTESAVAAHHDGRIEVTRTAGSGSGERAKSI